MELQIHNQLIFFFLPKWVSLCSYLVPFLDCCWFIKFIDLIKTRLRDIKIVKTKYKCQKICTILICDPILKMSCLSGFPYCSPHGLKSTISLGGRESFRHNSFNSLSHQLFFSDLSSIYSNLQHLETLSFPTHSTHLHNHYFLFN